MEDNPTNALCTPFSEINTHHRGLTRIICSYTKKSQSTPQKRPHRPTFRTILPPSLARAAAPRNSRPRFARSLELGRSVRVDHSRSRTFTLFMSVFRTSASRIFLAPGRTLGLGFRGDYPERPSPCLGTS